MFSLNVQFKHSNSTSLEDFLMGSSAVLGKKDLSKPVQILESHWVQNVGDLRLLVQEGLLRSLGLPLRLCVWIEEELTKLSGQPSVELKSSLDLGGDSKTFNYSSDLDTSGILYYLGTQGGSQAWQNPAKAGYVKVTTSGLLHDSVDESAVVGREVLRCVTKADPNAWMAVDFVDKWVLPTHYTVRHYSSWDTECLRSWRFEASNDHGLNWTLLREHVNDESLSGQGATYTWPLTLPPSATGFQMFRLKMTGPNSNQHLYLACSGFEMYGTLLTKPPAGVSALPPAQVGMVKEFKHEFPFDTNGIIYHLATQGATQAYVNPVLSGQVVVTSSSLMKDSVPVAAIVGRELVRCVTKPEENSWFSIDFLDKKVQPTHYSLRHYSSWDTEALRNWRFEASNDGITWTVLREHVEDQALNARGAAFTWAIPAKFQDQSFKLFRIFQTGVNSNKHHYLSLSGFEIYGKFIVPPAAKDPALVLAGDAQLKFEYHGKDLSDDGVIHYIATQGKAKPWTNPGVAGWIRCSASSLMEDSTPVTDIVGNQVVRCVTKPNPNSWFCIDLINKQVMPTHYTLRHYSSWDVEAVRNWNFEGSNDGVEWTVLRKHVNDAGLNAKGAAHTWDLPEAKGSYRMFRIFQWGVNSNKHNYLALSGFDIFGTMSQWQPQAAGISPVDDPQWNKQCSAHLLLDDKSGMVTNKGSSDKWQMVRSQFAVSGGQHRFAIKIVVDASTTNTWRYILGVIPTTFPAAGKEWVGAHGSWGYIAGTGGKCHQVAKSMPYGEVYGGGDVVGIALDFDQKTIEFFKNGVSQGIAFQNLVGPVNLAISMTGTGAMVSFASSNWIDRPLAQATTPTWDVNQKSRFLDVDEKTGLVVNRGSNDKWQSIRSVAVFSKGIQTFSVEIANSAPTPNNWRFIIGVVPPTFPLTWVGAAESWGYIGGTGGKCYNVGTSTPYGAKYGQRGDVISVTMNFDANTIEFSKNGESQGIAFTNLKGPVYAACSMTATGASCRLRLEG